MPQLTDPRALRSAFGTFATGVTVITTLGPKGEPVGNTVNSFNSVSLDPPLVSWSLARNAYSLKTYLTAEHFAVNVLREGQDDISARFASFGGGKWQGIDYKTWESGCPVLPNALAIFECRLMQTFEGGDHVIFLGEIIGFDHDPTGKPLIFWRGGYHAIDGQG
ncbi:MAG: flavin reductase family protein [Aestuariivirga sp.]